MPSHEEHCRQSFERYGKRFDELHTWMDEPSAVMGRSHRMHRHDPYRTPKETLERFGHMADHACLDHIKLDYQEKKKEIAVTITMERKRKITEYRVTNVAAVRVAGVVIAFILGMGIVLFFKGLMLYGGLLFLSTILLFFGVLHWFTEPVETPLKEEDASTQERGPLTQEEGEWIRKVSEVMERTGATHWEIRKGCVKCGFEYDVELMSCPKCGLSLPSSTNKQKKEGKQDNDSKSKELMTCLHCGLEYDRAQGICPRCGVAIGFTDYDEG